MRCTSKRSKNRTYKIITAFARIHEIQKKKKKPHYTAPKSYHGQNYASKFSTQ